jgi:hypothetical protein
VVGCHAVDLTEDERALADVSAVLGCNPSQAGEVAVVSVGWSRALGADVAVRRDRAASARRTLHDLHVSAWRDAEAGA